MDRLEELRLRIKRTLSEKRPLQTETSWFILVNVLDIVMTNILLRNGAMEANPIANHILIHWGFSGMIAFKLLSVVFVCLISQFVATKSMEKARALLIIGTLIVGCVVLYSVWLLRASI